MINKKSVLLIGGGGYIGINLTKFLYLNYQITILNRLNSNIVELKKEYKDVNFVEGDINKIDLFKLLNKNYNYIIWLAHSSVPASNLTCIQNINCDIAPLEKFLDTLVNLEIKPDQFLYFSSGGTIYGDPVLRIPIKEDDITKPISTYGLVKLIAENLIRQKVIEHKITTCILRPSNVYGELQNINKPQGIIIHAFNSILNGAILPIYHEGNIIRDFINDIDLVRCVKQILEIREPKSFEIFNISSSVPIKIIDLLQLVEKTTKKKLKVDFKNSRNFDCTYNVLDNNKIKDAINWKLEIPLELGIKIMWSKINNNEN